MTREGTTWIGFNPEVQGRVNDKINILRTTIPALFGLVVTEYEKIENDEAAYTPGYFLKAKTRNGLYEIYAVGQYGPYQIRGVIRSSIEAPKTSDQYQVWIVPPDSGDPLMTGVHITKLIDKKKSNTHFDVLINNGMPLPEVLTKISVKSEEGQTVGGLAILGNIELLTRETDRLDLYSRLLLSY